jgi:hypothetical protein
MIKNSKVGDTTLHRVLSVASPIARTTWLLRHPIIGWAIRLE